MNIALICDFLGKETNGTVVASLNLAKHLRSQGHTVKIFCGDEDRILDPDYVVFPRFKIGKLLQKYVDKTGVRLALCDKRMMNAALKDMDYIHCMMPLRCSRYAAKYAKKHHIPVSAGMHFQAENITAYFKLDKISFIQPLVYRFLYRHFFKNVDNIHYPTQFMRDTFEKAIGKKTQGVVISNGVNDYVMRQDTQKPKQFEGKTVIVCIGRYSPEKSQATLIKAVKKSKYKDKIQLIFAGDGVLKNKLMRMSKRLPVQPVFQSYSHNDLVNVLNYSDMCVHPAIVELEGIAVLEALKVGKLTIVSDSKSSATRQLVTDKRCVFKKKNPAALARVIDFWIENPGLIGDVERQNARCSAIRETHDCMKEMDEMMLETMAIASKAGACECVNSPAKQKI